MALHWVRQNVAINAHVTYDRPARGLGWAKLKVLAAPVPDKRRTRGMDAERDAAPPPGLPRRRACVLSRALTQSGVVSDFFDKAGNPMSGLQPYRQTEPPLSPLDPAYVT